MDGAASAWAIAASISASKASRCAAAASAVSTAPLSEYAGKTIPVQVVEETPNGLISRIINVAIPERATAKEETEFILTACDTSTASARSFNETNYGLSYVKGIRAEGDPRLVGYGTIPTNDIISITTIFDIGEIDHRGTNLLVQFQNDDRGYIDNPWETLNIESGVWQVVFRSSEYIWHEGNDISVYAKASQSNGFVMLKSIQVIANGR